MGHRHKIVWVHGLSLLIGLGLGCFCKQHTEPSSTEAMSASDEKPSSIWALLPSFDPATDDPREYTEKVRFLHQMCPTKDKAMLAPRLALQMRGTAWGQVKLLDASKLADPETGVETLLSAVAKWEESAELRAYENFEKALYRITQRPDESTMSYVNRLEVGFMELGTTSIQEMKAFVLLRQSSLGAEDKKKILVLTQGSMDSTKISNAMRQLSTKVLAGSMEKKKTYPVNLVDDEGEEDVNYTSAKHGVEDEQWDEEQAVQVMMDQGDEDACMIAEFEDQLIETCQGSNELSNIFTAYTEARQRLRDKLRARGFWPPKGSSKGKGRGFSGKKGGKGGQFRRRQSLAERIAGSHCRICGARGHWKAECPHKDNPSRSSGADANVVLLEQLIPDDEEEIYTSLPEPRDADEHVRVMDQLSQVLLHALLICMFWVWFGSKTEHEEFVCFMSDSRDLCSRLDVSLREMFRIQARPVGESREQVLMVSAGCPGIIDTGASKTVIGRLKTDSLLRSLPRETQARVQWRRSSTVFRFGNNGILTSLGAMFIPFGERWLKVEVVEGNTPFLLSIAFLRALKAEIHVASSELRIPGISEAVALQSNSKGLFQLELADVLRVFASKQNTSTLEEVITLTQACEETESKGITRPSGETTNPDSASCDSTSWSKAQEGIFASHGDVYTREESPSFPGGQPPIHGRGGRASSGPSTRGDHSRGVGEPEVPSRSPCGQDVCGDSLPRSSLRQAHEGAQEVDVSMGTLLPELCQGSRDDAEPVQGAEHPDAVATEGG